MNALQYNITVGADPEILLFDTELMSMSAVIGHLGGTKEEPRVVDMGAVQEDNVMAEYNIDPARTAQEFSDHHAVVQRILQELLPPNLVLTRAASHEYSLEQLESFGEEAFVMGCEPDFNVYRFSNNRRPNARGTGLRTAGGHVHIGYDDPCEDTAILMGRACDLVMGLPSLLEDKDERRRELYGSAGAIRFKPYGMEYRTLSNYWVFDDDMRKKIFGRAVKAVQLVKEGHVNFDTTAGIPASKIRRAINTNDKAFAEEVINQLGLV